MLAEIVTPKADSTQQVMQERHLPTLCKLGIGWSKCVRLQGYMYSVREDGLVDVCMSLCECLDVMPGADSDNHNPTSDQPVVAGKGCD